MDESNIDSPTNNSAQKNGFTSDQMKKQNTTHSPKTNPIDLQLGCPSTESQLTQNKYHNDKRSTRVSIEPNITINLERELKETELLPTIPLPPIPTHTPYLPTTHEELNKLIAQGIEKYLEQTNSQKSTQTSPTNDQATNSPLLAHNNGHLNDVGSPIDFLNNNVMFSHTQTHRNTLQENEDDLNTTTTLFVNESIRNNVNKVKNTFATEQYSPKDKRLLPIQNILASQLKPIRAPIEKISITNLEDTTEVTKRTKTLALWSDRRIFNEERSKDLNRSDLNNNLILDPTIYVPKSLQLRRFNLNISKDLRECDSYKKDIETLTNKFMQSKNAFITTCSAYAEEVATLNRDFAILKRSKNIIKGFVTLVHFLVIYSKKLQPKTFSNPTNKQNDLLASCILINFVKKLDDDYFIWLKTPKKDFLDLIVKDINENHPNPQQFINDPIIGQDENMLFECIADMMLIPIFINITKNLAELHEDRRDKIEEQNKLARIIKIKEIDQISKSTKEALEDVELENSGKTIKEHISAHAAKIESNLKKQFEQLKKSSLKNYPSTTKNKKSSGALQIKNKPNKKDSNTYIKSQKTYYLPHKRKRKRDPQEGKKHATKKDKK